LEHDRGIFESGGNKEGKKNKKTKINFKACRKEEEMKIKELYKKGRLHERQMRLKRPCRHQKGLFACDHWATRTFFSPQN